MWFSGFSRAQPAREIRLKENGREVDKGQGYVFQEDLEAAVDVALGLGRPLLVAGEPGCGKTELGYAIARRLGIEQICFFSVKSTSEARDLFYLYDAIGRFRDAQIAQIVVKEAGAKALPDVGDYVEFQALGRAILDAHERSDIAHLVRGRSRYVHPESPRRSVVIVDEIDKAPLDFPNDLLREIEDLSFRVPEFARAETGAQGATPFAGREPETPDGSTIKSELRPVIVVTSNEERQLPDAFLRRCVFHAIAFPNDAQLHEIILNGLRKRGPAAGQDLELNATERGDLIARMRRLRDRPLQKKPGVAELIDAAALVAVPKGSTAPTMPERLAKAVSALVKVREDRETFEQFFLR